MIYVHYFVGAADWYIAEYDPKTGLAFGYANLGDPEMAEWGMISLPELEEINKGLFTIVERDMHWVPRKFSEIK